MALNFPNSPTLNQIYTDSTSGFSYQWNGTVWISFSASTTNNISELDNISGSFNNSTTIFPLTVGGQSVSPASTNQLLISVGGVMQNPTDDYSVSGSNIVFTTAPTNGLTFFGTLLGTAVPIGISTIGDVYNRQVYSVTGVQTSFAFPSGYTVGYLDVFRNGVRLIAGDDFTATTGNSFSLSPPAQNTDDVEAIGYKVSTIAITEGNLIDLIVNQNATVLGITTLGAGVGSGTTALTVLGNARVTGILTVGSSSITLNGITDTINVGSGVTLSSSGINVTGVITATSFVGSGSGLTGVGIGTNGSVNTSGIITATAGNFTTLELGHATDTTLSRSAAGVLAVEGVVIPSVSSTNTLTNKTLTDPAIIGTILEDVFAITDGAAFEIDPGNGSVQLITLGDSRTPKATNMVAGESITLMVDDGSAYTITWTDATWGGSGVVWVGGDAPTLATSGYTVIQFWKVSTQVYGAYVGDVA
jgi:hypothetical protein